MSTASELKRCPKCGGPILAEAPQGLCPKCLLLEVSIPTEAGKDAPAKSAPPAQAELAAAFPHLEILELIGQGGMGYVFKARQPKIDRFVALKILPQSLAADPAFAERFTREGRLLARLNHPNIVTIHDFGQANGFFYLLMEFVDGVNLRQAMKAGRFTPGQALAVVPKICEALQYAHNEGILHRDIKPENILLDTKGRVKIADFGIAKLVGETRVEAKPSGSGEPPAEATLTDSGATLGTPNYMAPEQIKKPSEVDHRADIYSLGVVFYEMLTGELPLGRFAPPSEKSPMDPRLDDVVLRALEKEPGRRTQSAGEVKTQLETIALSAPRAEGISFPKSDRPRRRAGWLRRAAIFIAIGMGLALLIRFFALEPVLALTDRLGPEISLNSHCLVWKLMRNFSAGDVVVFRRNGRNYLARVLSAAPDSLVVSRNREPDQTVLRSSVIGLVVLNTRARAEVGTVKLASASGPVTTGAEQGKVVVLTGATNELIGETKTLRIVRVHTDSTLFPGETIEALMKLPDGRMEPSTTSFFIQRRPNTDKTSSHFTLKSMARLALEGGANAVQTSSHFSWAMPNSFSPDEFEAAASQLQQSQSGRPIVLNPGEPLELFSVTNQQGGVFSGYLEFKRFVPERPYDPAGLGPKVQASIRVRPYASGSLLVFYSAEVPPGYSLQATASGSDPSEGEASTSIAYSSRSPDYHSSWMPPSAFAPEQLREASAQLQQLAEQGSIQVVLGEPRQVFSITNKAGDVYRGFFELVGPRAAENATNTTASSPTLNAQPDKALVSAYSADAEELRAPSKMTNEVTGTDKDARPALTKTIALHQFGNNDSLNLQTDSEIQPGEAVVALLRQADGQTVETLTDTIYDRTHGNRSMTTIFVWSVPKDTIDPVQTKAARLQIGKNYFGRTLVLTAGVPVRVFTTTNSIGGIFEGYLDYRVAAARDKAETRASNGPTQAALRFESVNAVFGLEATYAAFLPPGNQLHAVAIDSDGYEIDTITKSARSANYASDDCKWKFRETFTRENLESATRQLEDLKQRGPVLVTSGQRQRVFSITNDAGGICNGYFELLAAPLVPAKSDPKPAVTAAPRIPPTASPRNPQPDKKGGENAPPGLTKSITFHRTPNRADLGFYTDSELQPGETIVALLRRSDGQTVEEPIMTIYNRHNGHGAMTTFFHWPLGPDTFFPDQWKAAVLQVEQNYSGKTMLLTGSLPVRVFSITNSLGGIFKGYLEYRVQAARDNYRGPSSNGLRHASVRLETVSIAPDVMATYSSFVPPGDQLRAIAVDSEGYEFDTQTHFVQNPYDYCTWHFPATFKSTNLQIAQKQLEGLKQRGPVLVAPGQRQRVFSITNDAGGICYGYFEVVGPALGRQE